MCISKLLGEVYIENIKVDIGSAKVDIENNT